jgi:2-polyprenyl-3-methyl-5-hydroxy-6-metoxy-1,4-benzoquinol methylase
MDQSHTVKIAAQASKLLRCTVPHKLFSALLEPGAALRADYADLIDEVLDLGCGDRTTALPEARLGAEVLGVDIARNLVAAGRQRAIEEGLTNCKFQEGDRQKC